MNRAKLWTVIASAAVVTSLLIAAANMASSESAPTSNRNARLARLQSLMNEGRTEEHTSLFRKKIKAHTEQVAGLDNSIPQATATEIAAPKKVEAKKEDKKKDDAKDKKKKAKKKKKIKGTGTPEAPSAAGETTEDAAAADTSAALGGGANSPVAATKATTNDLPKTVDEWFAYLVANPDTDHVSKFVQLAQIGAVTSAVFYPVTEKMLLDSTTPRMHEFAVLALGSTPSLGSFTVLAAVANEVSMEPTVKSQAMSYIRMYTRIEYVRHLGSVAALATDLDASLLALRLIQESAKMYKGYLANSATPSAANPTSQDATRSPASNVTRTFDAVIEELTKISTTTGSQMLRAQAAQTLSTLRALTGAA